MYNGLFISVFFCGDRRKDNEYATVFVNFCDCIAQRPAISLLSLQGRMPRDAQSETLQWPLQATALGKPYQID